MTNSGYNNQDAIINENTQHRRHQESAPPSFDNSSSISQSDRLYALEQPLATSQSDSKPFFLQPLLDSFRASPLIWGSLFLVIFFFTTALNIFSAASGQLILRELCLDYDFPAFCRDEEVIAASSNFIAIASALTAVSMIIGVGIFSALLNRLGRRGCLFLTISTTLTAPAAWGVIYLLPHAIQRTIWKTVLVIGICVAFISGGAFIAMLTIQNLLSDLTKDIPDFRAMVFVICGILAAIASIIGAQITAWLVLVSPSWLITIILVCLIIALIICALFVPETVDPIAQKAPINWKRANLVGQLAIVGPLNSTNQVLFLDAVKVYLRTSVLWQATHHECLLDEFLTIWKQHYEQWLLNPADYQQTSSLSHQNNLHSQHDTSFSQFVNLEQHTSSPQHDQIELESTIHHSNQVTETITTHDIPIPTTSDQIDELLDIFFHSFSDGRDSSSRVNAAPRSTMTSSSRIRYSDNDDGDDDGRLAQDTDDCPPTFFAPETIQWFQDPFVLVTIAWELIQNASLLSRLVQVSKSTNNSNTQQQQHSDHHTNENVLDSNDVGSDIKENAEVLCHIAESILPPALTSTAVGSSMFDIDHESFHDQQQHLQQQHQQQQIHEISPNAPAHNTITTNSDAWIQDVTAFLATINSSIRQPIWTPYKYSLAILALFGLTQRLFELGVSVVDLLFSRQQYNATPQQYTDILIAAVIARIIGTILFYPVMNPPKHSPTTPKSSSGLSPSQKQLFGIVFCLVIQGVLYFFIYWAPALSSNDANDSKSATDTTWGTGFTIFFILKFFISMFTSIPPSLSQALIIHQVSPDLQSDVLSALTSLQVLGVMFGQIFFQTAWVALQSWFPAGIYWIISIICISNVALLFILREPWSVFDSRVEMISLFVQSTSKLPPKMIEPLCWKKTVSIQRQSIQNFHSNVVDSPKTTKCSQPPIETLDQQARGHLLVKLVQSLQYQE